MRDRRATGVLTAALESDKDGDTRLAIVCALGEIADPSALEVLGHALQREDEPRQVREAVALVLRRFKDTRAANLLLATVKKDYEDPLARWKAGLCFNQVGRRIQCAASPVMRWFRA